MSKMKFSGLEWIGDIPSEWNLIRLRYLCSFKTGGTPPDRYGISFENNGYPWITAPDMKNDLVINSYSQYISEESRKICGYKLFPKHSILLVCIASVGKMGFTLEETYSNQQITAIIPQKKCDNKYLLYYINSMTPMIEKDASSSVVPIINTQYLSNILCCLPDIREQRLISDFLDNKMNIIDSIVNNLNKQIDCLTNYKESIISEKVFNGLNKSDRKKTNLKWIEKIPVNWEFGKKIKTIFNLSKGLSITKEDLVDFGVPVISYGQVHSKENNGTSIQDELIRYVDEEYLRKNMHSLLNKGDFIFADTSEDLEGCGNCVYVNKQLVLFGGYHTILLKNKEEDNRYFAYLFKTPEWRSQIREKVTAVKVYSITQKILKECKIIIPPKNEQKEIADYLDNKCATIDEIISNKKNQIEEIQKYKLSLIYEYVTGKKRVEGVEELYG